MKGSTEAHQKLISDTKIAISRDPELCKTLRLKNRPTGKFYIRRVVSGLINYLPMKINKAGDPDNYGTLSFEYNGLILPIHLELEFKTGNAVLSPKQKVYRDYCQLMGIWWFEVRNEYEFIKDLKDRIGLTKTTLNNINGGDNARHN